MKPKFNYLKYASIVAVMLVSAALTIWAWVHNKQITALVCMLIFLPCPMLLWKTVGNWQAERDRMAQEERMKENDQS